MITVNKVKILFLNNKLSSNLKFNNSLKKFYHFIIYKIISVGT